MSNVLLQEEVDSLLSGIGEGTVETETDILKSGEELQLYDFSTKAGNSHRQLPALGIINERFISFINASLSSATGTTIDVKVTVVA